MRLCLAAGRLDVRNVEEEMTDEDFVDWQVFYKLEPWDLSRVEKIVAHAVMASMRGSAKVEDLFPFIHHDLEHQREEFAEEIAIIEQRKFEAQKKAANKMAEIKAKVEADKKAAAEAKQAGK